MMSSLSAAADPVERSSGLEQRPRVFEVHTVRDKGRGVGTVQGGAKALMGKGEWEALRGKFLSCGLRGRFQKVE